MSAHDGLPRSRGVFWLTVLFAGSACVVCILHVLRTTHATLGESLAVIPDDTFYYLKIARNIAGGLGSTFDGENPTNGYHPLWMALLVPLAGLTGGGLRYVWAAQVLAFGVHALGAVAMGVLIARTGSRTWALGCAAAWLVSPWGVLQATQAMEAPLYQLTVLLLLLSHGNLTTCGAPRRTHFAAYSAALGAVALSRTDGAILCAISVATMFFVHGGREPRTPNFGRHLAWSVLAAALAWSVWGVLSVLATGTIIQDSAAMKQLWRATGASLAGEPSGVRSVLGGVWFGYPIALVYGGVLVPAAIAASKLLLIGTVILAWLGRPRDPRPWTLVLMALAWSILTGAAFGSAVTDLQLWHMVAPAIAVFLTVAMLGPAAAAELERRFQTAGEWGTTALGITLMGGAVWVGTEALRFRPAPYPWQPDVHASLKVFGRHLGPNDRTGSFNAGIPGYFASYPVVNLDGLVNHSVVSYWHERRWSDYLYEARITHVADEGESLARAERFSDGPLSFEILDDHELREWPSGRRILWRVVPRTARQPASSPAETTPLLTPAARP
jgi:hypothetical protein